MHRATIRLSIGLVILLTLAMSGVVGAQPSDSPADAFHTTWTRTDQPVADGEVDRTWIWGPEPFTDVITEPYAESPGGQRAVQYYDKARMEITTPHADPSDPWYVTTGLLATELITGELQVGHHTFEQRLPSEQNVAGDQGFANGPSYATFDRIYGMGVPPPGDRGDALVIQRIDRAGVVTEDEALAERGVRLAYFDAVTEHNIAAPFWDFMNAAGLIWDGEQYVKGRLFLNPFYATGRPISEPYWASVVVAGVERDVLIQCFERRCLTYTPDNPKGWRVEMGNIGRHYHAWRYAEPPAVDGDLLLLRYDQDDASGTAGVNLYTVNVDGSGLTNLTGEIAGDVVEAVWSPDSSQIAFAIQPTDFCCSDLYVVDADGTNLQQITSGGLDAHPAWSPDGQWIAFERHLGEDTSQIFIIGRDGSGERQLTGLADSEEITQARDPAWSSDGGQLAFHEIAMSVPPPPRSTVYIINRDGTGLTGLGDLFGIVSIAWSPSGEEILVEEGQHGGRDLDGGALWLFAPDHEPRLLIGNDYRSFPSSPVWSPDGSTIAYDSYYSGITLLNLESGAITTLTHVGVQPSWSPDGRYITFGWGTENLIGITSADGADQWIAPIEGGGRPRWRP